VAASLGTPLDAQRVRNPGGLLTKIFKDIAIEAGVKTREKALDFQNVRKC
jgi:hypothetical protein